MSCSIHLRRPVTSSHIHAADGDCKTPQGAEAYALVRHTLTNQFDGITMEGELVRLSRQQLASGDRGTSLAQLDFQFERIAVVP
jgi:hypothetical protein